MTDKSIGTGDFIDVDPGSENYGITTDVNFAHEVANDINEYADFVVDNKVLNSEGKDFQGIVDREAEAGNIDVYIMGSIARQIIDSSGIEFSAEVKHNIAVYYAKDIKDSTPQTFENPLDDLELEDNRIKELKSRLEQANRDYYHVLDNLAQIKEATEDGRMPVDKAIDEALEMQKYNAMQNERLRQEIKRLKEFIATAAHALLNNPDSIRFLIDKSNIQPDKGEMSRKDLLTRIQEKQKAILDAQALLHRSEVASYNEYSRLIDLLKTYGGAKGSE